MEQLIVKDKKLESFYPESNKIASLIVFDFNVTNNTAKYEGCEPLSLPKYEDSTFGSLEWFLVVSDISTKYQAKPKYIKAFLRKV